MDSISLFLEFMTIGYYFALGLGLLVFVLFIKMLFTPKIDIVLDEWQSWHNEFSFPPSHFFVLLRREIMRREAPGLNLKDIYLHEGSVLFSPKRRYLRIKRMDLVFEACAAPFGRGYFFSWYFGRNVNIFRKLILMVPWIGKHIDAVLFPYTYYHNDTAKMFIETFKDCVEVTIKEVFENKGVRDVNYDLEEIERILQLSA